MRNKLYLVISTLIIITVVIGFYLIKTNDKGPVDDLVTVINAEGILPYSKEISPKVGIIDTGISINNRYLPSDQIQQVFTGDKLTMSSDQIHGTMIAGVMIGNGTKGSQPKGLIPNSEIFSIQTGTDLGTTSENLAKAINRAIDNDVQILNISLATQKETEVLKTAVENALEKGIVIIAAAGNEGGANNYFPADYDGVISVGGINLEGEEILGNTNIKTVDIFVPGEGILTSVPKSEEKSHVFPSNSSAVPIVTSAVAILLNEYPELKPEDIEDLLNSSSRVKELKNVGNINILDMDAALNEAAKITK